MLGLSLDPLGTEHECGGNSVHAVCPTDRDPYPGRETAGIGFEGSPDAACSGHAFAEAVEGRDGNGVKGTGVAAPITCAIPVPPIGGAGCDQLLLSQTFSVWSIWIDVKC